MESGLRLKRHRKSPRKTSWLACCQLMLFLNNSFSTERKLCPPAHSVLPLPQAPCHTSLAQPPAGSAHAICSSLLFFQLTARLALSPNNLVCYKLHPLINQVHLCSAQYTRGIQGHSLAFPDTQRSLLAMRSLYLEVQVTMYVMNFPAGKQDSLSDPNIGRELCSNIFWERVKCVSDCPDIGLESASGP